MSAPAPSPHPDHLALAAIEPIRAGMVVGLGTGRAATRAVRALADRASREPLNLTCVATSRATEELAASLGLRVVDLNAVTRIDYLFDGADEVDPDLRMIKGGGAAMTREKVVAAATLAGRGRTAYLIDESKLSTRLGSARRLPIEVIPMARELVTRQVRALGLDPALRQAADGKPVITDNAGEILDALIPAAQADAAGLTRLDSALATLPGVIGHGLFLTQAQTLLIERPSGTVDRRLRPT